MMLFFGLAPAAIVTTAGLVLMSYGVWRPEQMGIGDRNLPISNLLTAIGAA